MSRSVQLIRLVGATVVATEVTDKIVGCESAVLSLVNEHGEHFRLYVDEPEAYDNSV